MIRLNAIRGFPYDGGWGKGRFPQCMPLHDYMAGELAKCAPNSTSYRSVLILVGILHRCSVY